MHKSLCYLAGVVAVLFVGQVVFAADPPATTITLKELDCPSCAKRLAGKLQKVPGVAEVKTDLEAKTVFIKSQAKQQPSARALWDATEKEGFEPVKLQGPGGTFTEKPKT